MIEYNMTEQVKKLIKSGFDLELLSFELDIPIEEIKRINAKLEEDKKEVEAKKTDTKEENIDGKKGFYKMKNIRKRYYDLYNPKRKTEKSKQDKTSKKDEEEINLIISKAEEKNEIIKESSLHERRTAAFDIVNILKEIQDKTLNIEQAERLYDLIKSEQMEKYILIEKDKLAIVLRKTKRLILKKLVQAIDIAQEKTEDLEELKELEKKIIIKIGLKETIGYGSLNKIRNKITTITKKNVKSKIRNNISKDIKTIVEEIVNGTLDVESAKKTIDEEIKKNMKLNSKNKFSLTQEQEKTKILMQIDALLIEEAEEYKIENPELAVEQIGKLNDGDLEQALRIVINNLMGVKDFEKAKEICDKAYSKYKGVLNSRYTYTLKKQIRYAEVADVVLKGIRMQGTEKEEEAYFELIEKGLKMGNVKPESIILGKSKDGLRNIHLSDVWYGKENVR